MYLLAGLSVWVLWACVTLWICVNGCGNERGLFDPLTSRGQRRLALASANFMYICPFDINISIRTRWLSLVRKNMPASGWKCCGGRRVCALSRNAWGHIADKFLGIFWGENATGLNTAVLVHLIPNCTSLPDKALNSTIYVRQFKSFAYIDTPPLRGRPSLDPRSTMYKVV